MQSLDNDTDFLILLDFEPEIKCNPYDLECDSKAVKLHIRGCCGKDIPLCLEHCKECVSSHIGEVVFCGFCSSHESVVRCVTL
jgi:hypothetical protein